MSLNKNIVITVALFFTISNTIWAQLNNVNIETNSFKEVIKEFPRQETNLRKWDAPVVADLDQDGYPDLLINDHGYGIQVCWNNKGVFDKPYDIIMGDLHGVSVGDFNKDGDLDIIMSRGGGSGSNARNSKMFSVNKNREFNILPNFDVPLELMRGRTVKFVDADNDGDLDLLNFAFPDAEKKGESENYVYENNGKGELILNSVLPAVKADGQKTVVTDFNGDAIFDIVMWGNGNVKAYKGNGDLTFEDVTSKIFPYKIDDAAYITEVDYDNDGDFDLFITRGKDFEIGETFFDKELKTWGFYTKRGEFKFDDLEAGDILNIVNFQSQWPNADTFFIGETGYDYEFPGETHSGKNIRLVNSNALGFPDVYNKKTGFYIGYVGNKEWRIAGFLWAPATGVVLGVNNYPIYKHPKASNDILLENKRGKFEDVTKKLNLFLEEDTKGVKVADFDNNGFQDLLIVRRGDLIHENESLVFLNQGGTKFELLKNHHIISTELGAIGMAVETIDYNLDGKVDVVVGNERGKWHLFKNELSEASKNNFITIRVGSSKEGNASALGALVEVKTCNSNQVQHIGANGAAYSLSFNNLVHFGLGSCHKDIKIKVTWTNGETLEKTVKTVNSEVLIGNNNIK